MNDNIRMLFVVMFSFAILSITNSVFGKKDTDINPVRIIKNEKPEEEKLSRKTTAKPLYTIKKDNVILGLNLDIGSIESLYLTNYYKKAEDTQRYKSGENINDTDKMVNILSDSKIETTWLYDKENSSFSWQVVENHNGKVVLEQKDSDILLRKIISIDDRYIIKIVDEIQNNSDNEINDIYLKGAICKKIDKDYSSNMMLHEGFTGFINGKLHEIGYSSLMKKDSSIDPSYKTGWFGISDQYWLSAFSLDYSCNVYSKKLADHINIDFESYHIATLAPGKSISRTSYLFSGAKEVDLLNDYSKKYGFEKLDLAINYGMLHFITKPLMNLLHIIYGFVGNFGWAIILLTILFQIVSLPFSRRSNRSISKLQKIQPKINKLKEIYANDKNKFNEEVAKLYQKEKVNLASGCLPVLLQMPMSIAMCKILYLSINMRHAPFALWIKDLSSADPLSLFNLFGYLPIDLPHFLQIGVLPLLMSLTMFAQQKLSASSQDNHTAVLMPLILLFVMGHFPSGFLLYWTMTNILSIIQKLLDK